MFWMKFSEFNEVHRKSTIEKKMLGMQVAVKLVHCFSYLIYLFQFLFRVFRLFWDQSVIEVQLFAISLFVLFVVLNDETCLNVLSSRVLEKGTLVCRNVGV